MVEPVGKRYTDDRAIVAVIGSHNMRSVPHILGVSTAFHNSTGTSYHAPDTADQSDCSASLHRPLIDTGSGVSTTHIKYLTTLRHTVFSPGATVKRHRKWFSGCTAYKNFSNVTGHTTLYSIIAGHDIIFPGILIQTSLFTEPLVSCADSTTDDAMVSQIRYLLERAPCVLWN
jgi:hypothetical protein